MYFSVLRRRSLFVCVAGLFVSAFLTMSGSAAENASASTTPSFLVCSPQGPGRRHVDLTLLRELHA